MFVISSSVLNEPFSSLYFIIACAFDSPIPGSVSNSSRDPVFIDILLFFDCSLFVFSSFSSFGFIQASFIVSGQLHSFSIYCVCRVLPSMRN